MFFKKHKSQLPPIARFKFPSPEGEPPEDPPNQCGNVGSIDNSNLNTLREDNSITNTAVKVGKILETIQTGSNSEVLIAAMGLLKMCEEREKEWEKEGEKMENEPLKNIKKLVIPNHVFTVGEIAYETSNEKPIKENKPWYTANVILYNLIGDNGELLASIQSNDAIILY